MSDLSIIFTLIFLAAALAIYGAYWVLIFNRREQQIVNRRLELSKQLGNPSGVLEVLRRERSLSNANNPVLRRLSDWLTQTGIRVQRRSLVLVFLALFLVLLLVLSLMFGLGLGSLVLAVITAAAVVGLYFARERSTRISEFGEQLPDAIDIIVRGVRVGLPLSTAVGLVAREMPDPIGTEFGMVADEITFGLDVRSALENLNRRVGQDDLLFLTVSMSVQSQTGGNLGEILSRLSRLMRDRSKMHLKIKALSAEGRASAIALSLFPFVIILALNFISPDYYGALRSHPIFVPLIYLGLSMLIVGNIIMYRMVHFKY